MLRVFCSVFEGDSDVPDRFFFGERPFTITDASGEGSNRAPPLESFIDRTSSPPPIIPSDKLSEDLILGKPAAGAVGAAAACDCRGEADRSLEGAEGGATEGNFQTGFFRTLTVECPERGEIGSIGKVEEDNWGGGSRSGGAGGGVGGVGSESIEKGGDTDEPPGSPCCSRGGGSGGGILFGEVVVVLIVQDVFK